MADAARALELWAERHGMHGTALAALDRSGSLIARGGSAVPAGLPLPVASLSKTVAGHCAMHLARRGTLALDSPVGAFLDWPGPQGAVTVAQLLTHTSGYGPDATQGDFGGDNLTSRERIARIVEAVKTRPLRTSGSAGYAYNNENYLVLEAVMTAALAEDALSWCLRSVPALANLDSLGKADATHALGFAGGLAMSAEDLALLFHRLVVGDDWPKVALGGKNEYGPGVIIQTVGDGQNLFHLGGICVVNGPNLGAYAARLANGTSVAIQYSGCADEAAIADLNAFVLAQFAR